MNWVFFLYTTLKICQPSLENLFPHLMWNRFSTLNQEAQVEIFKTRLVKAVKVTIQMALICQQA